MFDNLEQRLTTSKERWRRKQKLLSMLQQAELKLREEQTRCDELRARLAAEQADVDQLDGLSLTGVFYTVLGTKSERLEKERQELLSAKLKFDESVAAVTDAHQEMRRWRDELAPLSDVESEYQALIGEKEKSLTAAGGARAEKLLVLAEQLADLESDQKELQEALQAGQTALSSLRQVDAALTSAANWGTWDMLGGGMLTTMAKHSQIDTARETAQEAQLQLRRFQTELADADQRLHLSLEIDGFSKFADYFFDGLIADWAVQSKIQQASAACGATISQVNSAVSECRRRLAETQQQLEKVSASRRELLEQV